MEVTKQINLIDLELNVEAEVSAVRKSVNRIARVNKAQKYKHRNSSGGNKKIELQQFYRDQDKQNGTFSISQQLAQTLFVKLLCINTRRKHL